ncbi:hypothetical protein K2O51_30910 (plasmid) [Cupriavidus pinatubonensis]|uniref:competence protein CoiA family protein n=1 Tax=Cupriavidus pinatubonensis TaxID=248026 RepID=UPI001C73D8EF|nr:competence protein CoiA family protein [Cupriavidus pinatubonensis]QYY33660.1 hypothetical protein K2O51_30910 [Cupriavidus pinatubonensis]
MTDSAKLPYALDGTGKVVSVKDVPNGLACGCTCPECGARLVAKQGPKQVWHFSHYHAENSQAGYESALHLAVKALLEADPQLALPSCFVVRHSNEGNAFRGSEHATRSGVYEYVTDESDKVWARDLASIHDLGIAELVGKMVRFDRVEVERAHGNIRPDLVGFVGERRINLEVAVTHFVDGDKLARIRDLAVPTLEIIVPPSMDPDWEALRKLLHSPEGKFWRFNPLAEQRAEDDYKARLETRSAQRQRDTMLRAREAEMRSEALRKEAALRQREAEIRKRKAAIREEEYKVIAEVALHRAPDTFHLRWNASNVTLSVRAHSKEGIQRASWVAQALKGTPNRAPLRWEFPAKELLFFRIARAVKALGATVGKFSLPGLDPGTAIRTIGYLLLPVRSPGNRPPPATPRYCVTYRYGNQEVTILLDNTSLTLGVEPACSDDHLRDRIIAIAKQLRAHYNERTSRLEFPNVEAHFFEVASAMRPKTANDICQLIHPENVKTDDVLRQLGFDVP